MKFQRLAIIVHTKDYYYFIPHAGAINQYVNVRFNQGNESTRIILCIFPNATNQSKLLCNVEYKPCQKQNMTSRAVGIRNSSDTVIINLSVNLELKTYCYTITASNGSYTVLIEDTRTSSKYYTYSGRGQ